MGVEATGQPIDILLVEDDPDDVRLTQEALRQAKVLNRLSVVEDGVEAMAFLRREGRYARAPEPDLVLLDLNLPRRDGREVLTELKTDPKLKHIAVVVLTTSEDEWDVLQAYTQRANSYIVKPLNLKQFVSAVESVEHLGLTVVRLPPNDGK